MPVLKEISFANLTETPQLKDINFDNLVAPDRIEDISFENLLAEGITPTGIESFPVSVSERFEQLQIGPAPKRGFFEGRRSPLPPDADRIEKLKRGFDIIVGTPLRVGLKAAKGALFNIPDLMWAGIKKITPDSVWDSDVKKMTLDQAMDWAAGADPSGFELLVGDIAEFAGRLQTAKLIGTKTGILAKDLPKGATILNKAFETAKLFGLGETGRQLQRLMSEIIDPETDYQYEGGNAVLIDMGLGAGLSLGNSLIVKPTLAKTAQTRVGKAIIENYDRAMIEISKRFPIMADTIRRNPSEEISKLVNKQFKVRGIDPKQFTSEQKAVANHIGRELEKRFVKAFKNFKPPEDIVKARIKPKLIAGEIKPTRITPTKPPTAPPVAKVPVEGIKVPPIVKAVELQEGMATSKQIAKVHVIAREKGFLSKKGKVKPQYRRLAKAMTGQTSIARMTKEQASDFINAMTRLPEPRMVKGQLIPPSIPITTRIVRRGQFQQIFKEPTPIAIITDPSFYANQLGVKSLVEPLEQAKQDFDFEYRKAANELDKQGVLIDKIGKTTIKEKALAKIKNIPTKAREEMGGLLNTFEDTPPDINPEKAKIFNYFRGLTRTILQRQNEARVKLGWPEIKGRKVYMRRIATDISKEMLTGKYPFPEGVKFWSGINTGEKIFNPMEFRRKLEEDVFGLFVKDPVQASKAMMYTALKEIHLNQPLKFYKEQLNAIGKDLPEYKNLTARERAELDKTLVIPSSTRRWLTEYVNISILGRQSKIDELVNNTVTKSGIKGVFNKILAPFGRTVGRKPITDFFRRAGRAQMAGVLGPRPRLIIRNKFQLTQNLALYTNEANIRAFGPNSAELNSLLEQSRFLRDYTGLEDLPVDIAGKIEKLWHSAYQWSAKSNARQAMEVSYWDTKELIDNPKYKKHGWKTEHLLKEMEFGASATQFHYTALGMPQIFRHKTLLPMTRLTSWWMNYFAKFHREAIHRAFVGRPSWSGLEGPTLPWSRRLGWLRYIIIGGVILNTMGYTRSFLFGAAPTGWPPAMQFAWNAYLYTVSQNEKQKKTAFRKMSRAAKTFIPGYIAFKDFEAFWTGRKDLSALLFYKKTSGKKQTFDEILDKALD